MDEIKILIIEDDEKQLESYRDTVDVYNKKIAPDNIKFVYDECKTLEEGQKLLNINKYDAAIVDLKLEGDTVEPYNGTTLANEIIKDFRIPTFIYTGTPRHLDEIIHEDNIFFRKYTRGDVDIKDILDEIKNIFNTGITQIIGKGGEIEEHLKVIFRDHLASGFDHWIKNGYSREALLRHIVLHIHEYLNLSTTGELAIYDPAEVYIVPPIKDFIHVGDIVKSFDGELYIILTPACDMELREKAGAKERNADKILMVKLIKWDDVYNFDGLNSEIKKDKFKNFLKKDRYHFLPPYDLFEGYFIDFQDQISINETEVEEKIVSEEITRIATITTFFLKDIISRFTSYYSRQGSPKFDTEGIIEKLKERSSDSKECDEEAK